MNSGRILLTFPFYPQSIGAGLLQPIAVAKCGGKPAPNVPSPGQQVSLDTFNCQLID